MDLYILLSKEHGYHGSEKVSEWLLIIATFTAAS